MVKEKSLFQAISNLTDLLINKCYQNKIPILIAYQEEDSINENHAFIKDITFPRLYTAQQVIETGDLKLSTIYTTSFKQYNSTIKEFKDLLFKIKLCLESVESKNINLILAEIDNMLNKQFSLNEEIARTDSEVNEENDERNNRS